MAGYTGRRKLEDLDLTRQELDQIGDALKKEEFRKLLVDYVQEVNDPENKKLFQKEITQLEKERGYDVTFINPEPGYVIKTSVDDEKKAFINVCQSDKVQRPSSVTGVRDGTFGRKWSLPYTQAPPREDLDTAGKRCVVFDVVFHPEALEMASWNVQFRNMLNETALEGVESNYNVKLDRNNLKFPKMKYKGLASATVIRKKSEYFKPDDDFEDVLSKMNYPYNEAESSNVPKNTKERPQKNSETAANKSPYTAPKYVIKHRNVVDYQEFLNDKNAKLNATLPKEIIVEIDLPLLSSTTEAVLDVTEKSLSLVSEKPAKYKLFISLPYIVDEDAGNAKFDKTKRKLQITLPLKNRQVAPFSDFGREDSGVESDIGFRSPGSSSGEDDNVDSELRKESFYSDISHKVIHKIEEVNGVDEKGDSSNKSFVSVLDNEVFRTNPSAINFLDNDKHYSFPPFTCNVVDNTIIFTLHVKNVDPNSVNHCLIGDSCGIHIKFTSIGSGFFPIQHAFCTKFPNSSSIDEESVNIETWDNNVIVQIQLKSCDINLLDYSAGVNEDTLVKHDFPEPTVIAKKLDELKIECNESSEPSELNIEVTKCTKDETIVEISPVGKIIENVQDEKGSESSEDNTAQEPPGHKKSSRHPMFRTLSESSGDEMSFSPSKKGILKRVSRSLSESSADDYTWSSSLDMIMQSGSDSCIPEEEGRGVKKTVRFNEIVHQQTYRSNSSIFGQRKKNQRKTRNKKRAQERRASESENSEGEIEKDNDKEVKIEKNEEGEGDDDVNGDDDSPEINDVEEVIEVELKLQDEKTKTTNKKNRFGQVQSKGKKKIHKPVVTPVTKNENPKVDLKNELIFDLDM
ncbi:hypothetical protein R5R35_009809 [Gryllus longicercus]|uniref:Protein kintoun n=1 Tax=Gryllus longicercus TaxID=2509291 RepID=A0AAN9VQ55_9ORTH